VEKGEGGCIYMPTASELLIAMLACARIGLFIRYAPRSLGISYSPLDFEFLWCLIGNEIPGFFVLYNNLDKAWLEFQKLWYKRVSKNLRNNLP